MRLEGYVHGFEIDADHSLHIYQGGLVRVQADALVSSDNNYLSAKVGVSLALALAAGASTSIASGSRSSGSTAPHSERSYVPRAAGCPVAISTMRSPSISTATPPWTRPPCGN